MRPSTTAGQARVMDKARQYQILGTLGRGGFGTVYKALMMGSGDFSKVVALKVLNPEMARVEEMARRMRDEARVLGLVRHRAIVQVSGLVMLEGRWTIVMEYVAGVDLHKVMDMGPVPTTVALEVIEEIASALDAAQNQLDPRGEPLKLLHRDIKPSNLQLTERGEIKVLDFGTARANFAAREAKTQALAFGTLDYMSPERMDFEDVPAGDIYALGVVLWEMLAGQSLGKASPREDRHAALLAKALRRLKNLDTPEGVTELVMRMLAYDPTDRPDAATVASRARRLRSDVRGPWLADWAAMLVPRLLLDLRKTRMDKMTGTMLSEQSAPKSIVFAPGGPPPLTEPPAATAPKADAPAAPARPPYLIAAVAFAVLALAGCCGMGALGAALALPQLTQGF